jgi:hypothetical protein
VTVREQAVRLAGAWAELGEDRVVVRRGGAAALLEPRRTDLPAMLLGLVESDLIRAESLGVEAALVGGVLCWRPWGAAGGSASFAEAIRGA